MIRRLAVSGARKHSRQGDRFPRQILGLEEVVTLLSVHNDVWSRKGVLFTLHWRSMLKEESQLSSCRSHTYVSITVLLTAEPRGERHHDVGGSGHISATVLDSLCKESAHDRQRDIRRAICFWGQMTMMPHAHLLKIRSLDSLIAIE